MSEHYCENCGPDGHYGVSTDVRGSLTGVWGDLSGVRGDLTHVWGDLSGVRGDLSHVHGDLTGVRGVFILEKHPKGFFITVFKDDERAHRAMRKVIFRVVRQEKK